MSQETVAIPAEELEAQLLEGIVPIDNDPEKLQLVFAYKQQRKTEADDRKEKSRIGERIMARLTEENITAWTIGGVPQARKQIVAAKTVFDEAAFKAAHPELHREFMTKHVKGTVKIWVRPQGGDDAVN